MTREFIDIYTARFADGTEITKTSKEGFRHRLDVYNWICKNALGKKYGRLIEITVRSLPA